MKKIQLQLGKKMLSKEQMKQIIGGDFCGYDYLDLGCPNPNDSLWQCDNLSGFCYGNHEFVCSQSSPGWQCDFVRGPVV